MSSRQEARPGNWITSRAGRAGRCGLALLLPAPALLALTGGLLPHQAFGRAAVDRDVGAMDKAASV